MPADHWRGHTILRRGDAWVYADTEARVDACPHRDCGHCGGAVTGAGHDFCLGTLPGVVNACCGHGHVDDTYVVLATGTRLSGHEAFSWVVAALD